MSKRSVYYGLSCIHCHKHVAVGRSALASTYYVVPGMFMVSTQSMQWALERVAQVSFEPQPKEELRIRIVYHRACLEGILDHAPLDHAIEIAQFEQYRAELAERFGVE